MKLNGSIASLRDGAGTKSLEERCEQIEEALLMAAGYCKQADSSIEQLFLEDRRIIRQLIDERR